MPKAPAPGAPARLLRVPPRLNAIGAYGFLAKAHIGHALAGDLAVPARAADIEARISVQAGKVADLTKQIADLGSQHRTGRADGIPVGNGAAHLLLVRHAGAPPTPPLFARDFQPSGARSASKWCF